MRSEASRPRRRREGPWTFVTLVGSSALLASTLGCEASPATDTTRGRGERPSASKATYYADATLLPDRRSARRREEAALAAEVDALCALLPGVRRVRSSVSLADTPTAVVVVQHETLVDPHVGDRDGASPSGQGDVESLEAMIQVIAAGVVPGAEIDVLTLPRTPPGPSAAGSTEGAPEPTRGPLQSATRTVLWLALGITLGVLFERIASRRNLRRA